MAIIQKSRELFWYGLPRTPRGITFSGLFAIGPFFASRLGSMEDAGYTVIGQSVLQILQSSILSFGLVALPKVAQLFAEGKEEFLKQRITDVIALVFHLGIFVTAHVMLWSDQVVTLWLGSHYAKAISFVRLFSIALMPYLAYAALNSIIDAVEKKAVNTINLLISIAVATACCLVLSSAGLGAIGLSIGVVLGFVILGFLSALHLFRLYRIKMDSFLIKKCLLLNSVFIFIAFSSRYGLEKMSRGMILVAMGLLMEGLLFALYYIALRKWNVRWTAELERRIVRYSVRA